MISVMNLLKRAIAAIAMVSLGLAGFPTSVAADVQSEMNGYYRDMSTAQINVNGPGAYQSQAGGYYTGGSLYARFPQKNVQLFNLQLPSAKAGCGGIDIFGGSFSFVDSDQYIALAKSVLNNAKGYIFKLAISALSGLIGSTLGDIQGIVDNINSANINSCKAAEGLVNRAMDAMSLGDTLGCQQLGNSLGYSSDWSAAMQDCTNPDKRRSNSQNAASSNDPEAKALSAEDTGKPLNVTWKMLMTNPEFADRSREFNEMVMSMVGTVVVGELDDKGQRTVTYKGGDVKAIMQGMLDGTDANNVKGIKCSGGDLSADGCTDVGPSVISIPSTGSLRGMVFTDVSAIEQAIVNNQPLTSTQKALLENTSIPVYKILVVLSAKNGAYYNSNDIQLMSDLVAIDMLDRLVSHLTSNVAASTWSSSNATAATMAQWQAQFNEVRRSLEDNRAALANRFQLLQGLVQRSALVESTLQNSLSSQMQASIGFARTLRRPGL